MEQLQDYLGKLGRIVVGVLWVWLGAVGFVDVGFTTIDTLPLVQIDYVRQLIFASQVIIGIGIFNFEVKRFSKVFAMLYFLALVYSTYVNIALMFEPAAPYLSDLGRDFFLELLLIFAGYSYLRHTK